DAAINLATAPGATLGEMFGMIQRAYAESGFPNEWNLHHQGGPTGYATREALATPGSPLPVLANQAFAWNPSIAGTKSEDTILCGQSGIEFLTQPSKDWPTVEVERGGQVLQRPGILVV
ncbi:MAG: M24 family metallopeptidase, partial [Tepidisphaeraceae bacterium]